MSQEQIPISHNIETPEGKPPQEDVVETQFLRYLDKLEKEGAIRVERTPETGPMETIKVFDAETDELIHFKNLKAIRNLENEYWEVISSEQKES